MTKTLEGLRVVLEVEELKNLEELRKSYKFLYEYCNRLRKNKIDQQNSGHSISGYIYFCQDQAFGTDWGLDSRPLYYSDISTEIAKSWKEMSIRSRKIFLNLAKKGPHDGESTITGEFPRLDPLETQQAIDALENNTTEEWNMIENSDSEDNSDYED
jgi:hypothetical protein